MATRRGRPAAETAIDAELVDKLLAAQHPDLATLPLKFVAEGWDNMMFRLGDDFAVRLPRRASAVQLLENERRVCTEVTPELPIPTPIPERAGLPGCGYPWPWSVVRWLPGRTADEEAPTADQAFVLADFLRALHTLPCANAPNNPFRCIPLSERAEVTEERLARVQTHSAFIDDALFQSWREAVAAPQDLARTWIHADLHARNVLVTAGRITGVVDWGDATLGDPALDLASVWMLLPEHDARTHALASYGRVSAHTLKRARGWAIFIAAVLYDGSVDDDTAAAALAETMLERVCAGPV